MRRVHTLSPVTSRRGGHQSAAASQHLSLATADTDDNINDENGYRGFTSLPMRRLMSQAERVARSAAPVFIMGPAGSGKRWLAREIMLLQGVTEEKGIVIDGRWLASLSDHKGSAAALQEMETGLSGKWSYIVIHRVESLPVPVQSSLLAYCLRPTLPSAPRLILTSTLSHDELRISGRMMSDLFEAFGWVYLKIPPLKDRTEDIAGLALHFAKTDSDRSLTPGLLRSLASRTWPGDVRELRESLMNAATASPAGALQSLEEPGSYAGEFVVPRPFYSVGLNEQVDAFETHLIVQALKYCSDNQTHAANLLKINRQSLIKKMKRLGLT